MINIRQFCFLISLSGATFSSAQKFNSKISQSSLTLPSVTIEGFQTNFDFEDAAVEKGWWRYAKKFALPKNMRTHYEVTIPGTNDSQSVVIYTMDEGNENATKFKLGLKLEGMTDEDKTKYSGQAKEMLLDFKRWFYLRHFESEIETLEKAISRKGKNWSEWILFIEKRNQILEKMKGI